ncbi:hypothetical protein OEA41_010312 [Lepraria neglecta]|uniref:Uncharacterized protein n=1 Tax=Lepraria neglecta TaxID=209136 RepID=A0AAE0DF05_9LECA|nr:hypothetical protein OEA41_010312 [Lepraria neglecta]
MNRQSPATNNPRMKPLLDRLHQKCTFQRANETGEDLAYHICREAFLASATSPEIPVKLPYNHLCGLSYILRWLAPLSSEPRDTCPLHREPILGEAASEVRGVQYEPEWLDFLNEWSPVNAHELDVGDSNTAWMLRADELWFNLCEDIVKCLEATEDPEDWLCYLQPLFRHVVNFVTVQRFVEEYRKATEISTMPRLLGDFRANVPQALDFLLKYLNYAQEINDVWGAYPYFFAPTSATFQRVASYHQRLAESNARLSYHLRAPLQSGIVEDTRV